MCLVNSSAMRSQTSILLLIVGVLLHEVLIVSGKPSCPAGQFRNLTASPVRCSACSTCPINHIVRKPCNRQNDTVCGPFYEFEFFNQRQQKTSQPSEVGHGWKQWEDDRQPSNGEGKDVHHSMHGQQTTSNSPDEASTVRCGHPEWRVLCYGLVVALVVVISVALSAFAVFSYCRANAKTFRLPTETSGAMPTIVTNADASSYTPGPPQSSSPSPTATTTTIVVDRSVRHLEEQLFHNERRKAFLRWLFGSSAAADRLFSSNDYLEERHRRRFLLLLDPSTANRRPTDAVPLQPYPGMISIGRRDHDGPPPPIAAAGGDAADAAAADDADTGDSENGNRMDRTSRSDEGQAYDQGTNHGERSLLIPE